MYEIYSQENARISYMTKRALILAGGGTKGIYQIGAIEALKDLGLYDFDMILGTSVGALNAVLLVQNEFDRLLEMYEHIDISQFVGNYLPNPDDLNISSLIKDREEIISSFKSWVKDKGIDTKPFEEMVHEYFNPDKFFASNIDFGCIVATKKDHKPVYVTKEMMKEKGEDWLIATSSAYPAFPVKVIDEVEYIDGGYFDNLPIDYALRKGAEDIVAIDLSDNPIHPNYLNRDGIVYIHPHVELYNFLNFDHQIMNRARILGYLDTMKIYGALVGEKYTFAPFEIDKAFDKFYRNIMLNEAEIKQATTINDKFRSDQLIINTLLQKTHKVVLSKKEVFYALLDEVMDICDMELDCIYDYEDARKRIFEEFSECAYEGYYVPSGVIDVASYVPLTDKRVIVSRLVYAKLFPEHELFPAKIILTVYPFEETLADFIVYLMKEYVEDVSCKESQNLKK